MTREPRPKKAAFVIANPKSKLLDQVREVLRVKHYSLRPGQSYCDWVLRFLKYQRDCTGGWKHPREMGGAEVGAFLSHLAAGQGVAAATLNQVLKTLAFLYNEVLHQDLGGVGEFFAGQTSTKGVGGVEPGGGAAVVCDATGDIATDDIASLRHGAAADGVAPVAGEGLG
jgi:hypothetical protein